jgi:uncharacterized iron-regulated membrane protein
LKLKKAFGKIHLWLGLSSGLVVFIISITGCLYAFQEEISDLTQPFRFCEASNSAFLPPSELKAIAELALPNKHLHAVKYNEPGRAAEAIFYAYDPEYYFIIYLNPYHGEVLKVKNMDRDFFRFVLNGHFYLWMPPKIGQTTVVVFMLVFLVMLISGLVLWFPKNRAAARQRFWFRWKEGMKWKRKNYDLHNIPGFYACLFALLFVVTGLVWGLPGFGRLLHQGMGGKLSLEYEAPVSKLAFTVKNSEKNTAPIDIVFEKMRKEYPTACYIEVHPPENDSSSIAANANLGKGTYWKTDYRYFDQFSLAELPCENIYGRFDAETLTAADKLFRMNYDIHVGAIGGLPGKVLAFGISLMIASLPVSGFLIWWGRRKKNHKK